MPANAFIITAHMIVSSLLGHSPVSYLLHLPFTTSVVFIIIIIFLFFLLSFYKKKNIRAVAGVLNSLAVCAATSHARGKLIGLASACPKISCIMTILIASNAPIYSPHWIIRIITISKLSSLP